MSALTEPLIIHMAMVRVRSPFSSDRLFKFARVLAFIAIGLAAGGTFADEGESSSAERQSLDNAWWTGPIVTAGAGTLPQGHALIEPYLFDVVRYARYDVDGRREDAERGHSYGSLTYMLYGVTDKFTAGLIPTFGYNDASNGPDSSAIQVGDLAIQGQYRLSQFREGGRVPTTSLVVQETLPTGKYDRLGSHPNDGFGAGAYTTMIALYSQYYFWMPNGRILRARFNVSQAFSNSVDVADVSVYGTGPGFRGHAEPGNQFTINSSFEYSITRNWVFALDLVYQRDGNTGLHGAYIDPATGAQVSVDEDSGSAWRVGVAPAIEYNWSARVGLIVGARWFGAGRNTSATITPAIALNMVY
jgi:hypothetical protein